MIKKLLSLVVLLVLTDTSLGQQWVRSGSNETINFKMLNSANEPQINLAESGLWDILISRGDSTPVTMNDPDLVEEPDDSGNYHLTCDEFEALPAGEDTENLSIVINHVGCVELTLKVVHYREKPDLEDIISITTGTADSGSTTTLVDAALTQSDADYWRGLNLEITSGSTVGQIRQIIAFAPGTDTLTFDRPFTQAISTNNYRILRSSGSSTTASLDTGTAQGGSTSTIILASTASSTNNFYSDTPVWIYAGTGAGQIRWGHSYNGGTRTLTVRPNWVVAPNSTSQYVIIPFPMGFAKWIVNAF